jgi:hypothetical protein
MRTKKQIYRNIHTHQKSAYIVVCAYGKFAIIDMPAGQRKPWKPEQSFFSFKALGARFKKMNSHS